MHSFVHSVETVQTQQRLCKEKQGVTNYCAWPTRVPGAGERSQVYNEFCATSCAVLHEAVTCTASQTCQACTSGENRDCKARGLPRTSGLTEPPNGLPCHSQRAVRRRRRPHRVRRMPWPTAMPWARPSYNRTDTALSNHAFLATPPQRQDVRSPNGRCAPACRTVHQCRLVEQQNAQSKMAAARLHHSRCLRRIGISKIGKTSSKIRIHARK